MSPTKIMLIRRAEKPIPEGANGVDAEGDPAGPDSLSQIGWSRACALVNFFTAPTAPGIEKQNYLFAAKPDAESRRPLETVTQLAEKLWPPSGASDSFNALHLKEDLEGAAAAAMAVEGVALVCWEHKVIPALVAKLPRAPATPSHWPKHRFDVVWVLDASAEGWLYAANAARRR